jgi:UDP-GlcNAc:undecaprenyl-phosphate GlcNAc-1-phosphate transferase
MMPFYLEGDSAPGIHYAFIVSIAFVSSLLLTTLVRWISLQCNFVYRPVADRWSRRVVALGGGISIHLTIGFLIWWLGKSLVVDILPAIGIVFLLGLIDDIWGLMPAPKLIFQALAGLWLISRGYVFPFPIPYLAPAISLVWIMGLSNAFNIIDNMDGLASAIAAIAALGFFYLFSGPLYDPIFASLALIVGASALGFLVYNFPPARIFMGDVGSLPFGILLAALGLRVRVPENNLAMPLLSFASVCLILVYPLFDTVLVSIARRKTGRPISVGGRDHSSHRLVLLGLTEKQALVALCLFEFSGVLAAIGTVRGPFVWSLILNVGMILVLILAGIFLLGISIYGAQSSESAKVSEFLPQYESPAAKQNCKSSQSDNSVAHGVA